MKTKVTTIFWAAVFFSIVVAVFLPAAHRSYTTALAQPASIPSATYGRMTVTAANPDAGGAIPVPPTCMSPRSRIEVQNFDTGALYCGWDNQVTGSGAHTGWFILPVTGGVPGTHSWDINCDGVRGVLYCWSDAGTATNTVEWSETR